MRKKTECLATNFYFEGIILYGDVTKERGLNYDRVEFKPYAFESKLKKFAS